jgi:4-hydroxyphenylacetate 3-monooxygenase oxygenase component
MMGWTPDFLNCIFSSWAGAADYFAQDRPQFKKNVKNYYEFIRENDLTLTHALVNLQRSRSPAAATVLSDDVALTVVDENDAGIVVRGSRVLATLGPISDEIAIYPVASHRLGENASRQSFSFSIPCDTPGLKFLCRESFDLVRSHFDHPLGSRFEEMDSTVFFDDVQVPWERVFLLGDVDLCNGYAAGTTSNSHTGHQVLTRCVVKAEFILGLADLMVETLGSGSIPHVQEQVAELITQRDTLRACLRAAEADAEPNQYGVMSPAIQPIQAGRTIFGRSAYPRMIEIIQLLGTSSLMALPADADFATDLGPEIDQYLSTDTSSARDLATWHGMWLVARLAAVRCSTSGCSAAIPSATPPCCSAATIKNYSSSACGISWERTTDESQHGNPEKTDILLANEVGGNEMSYKPMSLGHLVMRVRDMDRSLDFYTRVMGLTIMERSPSGTVFMSANTEKSHELAIRAIGMDAGGPEHSIIGQAHMAWQMETFEDLQELYNRLIENDVRIVRMGDHGISMGVYLLDPDDNEIEVYYESPKAEWTRHPEKGLFGNEYPRQLEEPVNAADD